MPAVQHRAHVPVKSRAKLAHSPPPRPCRSKRFLAKPLGPEVQRSSGRRRQVLLLRAERRTRAGLDVLHSCGPCSQQGGSSMCGATSMAAVARGRQLPGPRPPLGRLREFLGDAQGERIRRGPRVGTNESRAARSWSGPYEEGRVFYRTNSQDQKDRCRCCALARAPMRMKKHSTGGEKTRSLRGCCVEPGRARAAVVRNAGRTARRAAIWWNSREQRTEA